MKEALQSPYAKLVFRETFRDEQSVRRNSGTPTAGTTNVIIGNRLAGARTFDGAIPLLQVYEGILSVEDITQIWSSTRSKFI